VFDHFQTTLKNAKKASTSSSSAKAVTAAQEKAAAEGNEGGTTVGSDEAVATMKSAGEEFQCLLDHIKAAATGVAGDADNATPASADDAEMIMFEASIAAAGKKKARPTAPGTAGKEKKKSRLSTSDDESENQLSSRSTRGAKKGGNAAAAARRPLRPRQANAQEEMDVEYSDDEVEAEALF